MKKLLATATKQGKQGEEKGGGGEPSKKREKNNIEEINISSGGGDDSLEGYSVIDAQTKTVLWRTVESLVRRCTAPVLDSLTDATDAVWLRWSSYYRPTIQQTRNDSVVSCALGSLKDDWWDLLLYTEEQVRKEKQEETKTNGIARAKNILISILGQVSSTVLNMEVSVVDGFDGFCVLLNLLTLGISKRAAEVVSSTDYQKEVSKDLATLRTKVDLEMRMIAAKEGREGSGKDEEEDVEMKCSPEDVLEKVGPMGTSQKMQRIQHVSFLLSGLSSLG